MKMPSIPTDNLYKFLATFGLVLIVFSSYMFNQTVNSAYYQQDELNAKDSIAIINEKAEVDSINLKIDKVQINKEFKRFSRLIKRLPSLLNLYLGLFLTGVLLSTLGFYKWYYKTQKFNDDILKNESEKFIKDKAILVHRIQFEKEFDVYKSLWPELIKLRNSTQQLRPMVEFMEKDKTENEIRIKKGNEFNKYFRNCVISFEDNKPFYPEDIYKEIETILRISKHEAIEWEHMPNKESDYYKNAEKTWIK